MRETNKEDGVGRQGREIFPKTLARATGLGQTKKEKILKDEDVRRWYENLRRGSPVTAETAIRRLSKFSEENRVTPKALVAMGKKKAYALLLDYVTRLEREEYAPQYIVGICKAVKSWLAFHSIQVGKVRVSRAQSTTTDERVPRPNEVDNSLAAGDSRCKVEISLMAYSGLRPEVEGNYEGRDGLRLKDLPELSLDGEEPHFEGEPPYTVVVRQTISKMGDQYFSLFGSKTAQYVVGYLKERMKGRVTSEGRIVRKPEILTPDSPLIKPTAGKKNDGEFLTTANISDEIRRAMRKGGLPWRPYIFRSFFDSMMTLAENDGKISGKFVTFLMGHRGDIENTYTTHKHTLSEDMLLGIKEGYARASEYLLQSKTDQKFKELQSSVNRQIEDARIETKKQVESEVQVKLEQAKEEGKQEAVNKIDLLGRALTILLKRTIAKGDIELSELTEEDREVLAKMVFSREVNAREILAR